MPSNVLLTDPLHIQTALRYVCLLQVSSQVSRALSTADGRSLMNASASYPWKGPAFLRFTSSRSSCRHSNLQYQHLSAI